MVNTTKTIKFLAFAIILNMLGVCVSNAQKIDKATYEAYKKLSGSNATIYRGKLPKRYLSAYNGNPFWSDKEYVEGEVLFNGKVYENVLLNIDAYRMDLLCRFSYQTAPIVLSKEDVKYAVIGGKLFVNLNGLGYSRAPEGYYEVLKDGEKALLRQVRKIYLTDAREHNGTDIGYYDPNYNEDYVNYFLFKEKLYTISQGKVKAIGKSAGKKIMKDQDVSTPVLENMARQWTGVSSVPGSSVLKKHPAAGGIGLPDDYFASTADRNATSGIQEESITVSYRNKLYVIGSGDKGERVTVRGQITELETGLPLAGVVVFDENSSTYDRSKSDGTYRITLESGENVLNFRYDGKEDLALRVDLLSNGTLNVEMPDKIEYLEAAVVSAESMENHRTATMGVEAISLRTMNKIPSAFGEGDIMKAVLTLPGVKTVGEASGGLNVRGGSQDQNLILFNGNTLYNPSHLFGLFSAFNPDAVESVELYKSAIPAEYGGRISSVLAVKAKEGNKERIKGSAGLGLLTSRIAIDGPVGKKTSFLAAARTSYSDWMLKRLPKNSIYSGAVANFSDANLSLTHQFNEKNSVQLFGYFATDNFSYAKDTSYKYTNANASLTFTHKEDDHRLWKVNAGYDYYTNRTSLAAWLDGAFNLDTYIRQAFARFQRELSLGKHRLRYGMDAVGYDFTPGRISPADPKSKIVETSMKNEFAIEPAAYIQDSWDISPSLSVEGGLRASTFYNSGKFFAGPELRLSARYSPAVNVSFKGGLNTMRQYIHLLSNTASISPMDTWKLSDKDIAPTTGWQAAGGAYWTLLSYGIDLSAEIYYKRTKNALDFKPGAILSMNENLADELIPVFGRSYGIELLAKKTTGKLTGWASYSYSKSQYKEMEERGYEAIAAGNWYNTAFDKPHEFKLSGNYALTHRYSISVNIDYSTGRPVTVPVGIYTVGNRMVFAYADRNSYRIPDYFRVDAAFNIDPGHYKKSPVHTTFTFGVYNITGRKNAYSAFFKQDYNGIHGYILSVFATQIPYANINILF